MKLSGWGNYPRVDVTVLRARGTVDVLDALKAKGDMIARGNGRTYGDAALNISATLSMLPANRMLDFDPETGRLTCEAGVLLADILDLFIPRGWFVPVTPGTKFVTIGGMVASDVHGKNHHGAGSFCDHVETLVLALADGSMVNCGPQENVDLFAATRGGMGLTGIILSVTFRLMPIETVFIRHQTLKARNLPEVMALFEASQASTYSVAWIDCLASGSRLGRSVLYLGEHAGPEELPAGLPLRLQSVRRKNSHISFDLPSFILNRWSVRAFNELIYRKDRAGTVFIDYDKYFYPLDSILEWNRLYGSAGFVQYQCVMPKTASLEGMTVLLERITQSGLGSFLAVLKLFGDQPGGMLSFPMEGYTLALDFPANARTFSLLIELDAIVGDYGGRVYLAKDARGSAALLKSGYPRLSEFQAARRRFDPEHKFSSIQSQRLGI